MTLRHLAQSIAATAAACILLGWLGPVALDGQPLSWAQADHQHEWLQARDLADAQAQAATAHQRELRAARHCRQLHGEAALVWTADDMPVCVPRRATRLPNGTHWGTHLAQHTQGAQP